MSISFSREDVRIIPRPGEQRQAYRHIDSVSLKQELPSQPTATARSGPGQVSLLPVPSLARNRLPMLATVAALGLVAWAAILTVGFVVYRLVIG